MMIGRLALFTSRKGHWQQTYLLVLITFILSACGQTTPYLYEPGEEPIPPGIENQIHPNSTTQDDVLALLGEPVARLKTKTKEGHIHIWTYSYMNLQGTQNGTGESLTITFDDKSFVVLSVIRGPL
jgi:SmpA/OmlA family protein